MFYNAIKIDAMFNKFESAIKNFVNLCFLTKSRFVNELTIKNTIEFNETRKQSFFRYSNNSKNNLYYQDIRLEIISFDKYITIS